MSTLDTLRQFSDMRNRTTRIFFIEYVKHVCSSKLISRLVFQSRQKLLGCWLK